MPTPRLTKDEANRRIALVEEKLKAGHPPPGHAIGAGQRGAIRAAAAEDNKSVGASNSWLNASVEVAGREPDWSLYQPPEREAVGRGDFFGDAPDGWAVKGRSTYYAPDGTIKGEWVKTTADAERQAEMMREAIRAMAEKVAPAKKVKPPKAGNEDLLNLYVLTDYHLGMLSWPEETGDDWNLEIAADLLIRWFRQAIDQSPAADTAILGQLGDFLHADGLEALTPASKHILDVDTRFQRVVREAIRVLRAVVHMLLEKYRNVHVIMADANHDPVSGIWLREMFSMHYESEPRVTVETSPEPYYCFEHGLTSLFFHHGHKRKVNNVDDVFAARFREVFGRTKFSYGHLGHLHHRDLKESNLMIVEQHRTLASKDAYAARGGYLTGRDAQVITYSAKHGEVGRITLTPEMVAA